MTNDRRKTFNTPLEFWRWAIMEPGKRKARASGGEIAQVQIGGSGKVYLQLGAGHLLSVDCLSYPLTAVEDEHGVIDEPGTAEGQYRKIAGDREASALIALIDERIAAATMEQHCLPTRDALFSIPGTEPAWIPRDNLRLKPKGE